MFVNTKTLIVNYIGDKLVDLLPGDTFLMFEEEEFYFKTNRCNSSYAREGEIECVDWLDGKVRYLKPDTLVYKVRYAEIMD